MDVKFPFPVYDMFIEPQYAEHPDNDPNSYAYIVPKYMVAHEVAFPEDLPAPNFIKAVNKDGAGSNFHEIVDVNGVYRALPIERLKCAFGWHCHPIGNRESFGIEMSHYTSEADFRKAYDIYCARFAYYALLNDWDISYLLTHGEVVKRNHQGNHSDPDSYFLSYGITIPQFKQDVANWMDKLKQQYQPQQPPKSLYKVYFDNKQQGAYGIEANAYKFGWDSYNAGKVDTYLTTPENNKYTFDKHQDDNPNKPQPVEPPKPQGTLILGTAIATLEQAKQWAKERKGITATQKFIDLADLYCKIAPEYGVRADIAYAQAAKETKFGNFGGVLNESFHNWCGMKNPTGGGDFDPNAHFKFPDDETGIRAHIQHLAWYAGVDDKDTIVDPRHFDKIKGTAKTVEELIHWSSSTDYGITLVASYLNPMIATVIQPQPEPKPIPQPDIPTPMPTTPVPKPLPIPEQPKPDERQIPKGLVELIVEFLVKLFGLFGKK